MHSSSATSLVLFDGWCRLCCSFAGWLLRHDSGARLLTAPLQGESARKLLSRLGHDSPPADSIILVENGGVYLRSTAVLKIMGRLGPPWRWLYPLIYIPRPLRDLFYRLVAALRYRVFGRRNSCRTPEEGETGRMLP